MTVFKAAAAVIVQENHYYPFGQNMVGIEELDQQSLSSQEEQKFQYNAKEKLDEFQLYWNDHGARNLDLQTLRWTSVDPLAEKFSHQSPYCGMDNNPVNLSDPTGKSADVIDLDKDNNVVKVVKQDGPNIIRNHNGDEIEVNQASESAQNIKIGDKFNNGELYRKLNSVNIYRDEIDINGADQYGHWWLEMNLGGEEKSYGWWPKDGVDYLGTLFGVEGELNGVTNFDGSANRDPHHGDRKGDHYPVYSSNSKNGEISESTIKNNIIEYSKNYSGSWSWPFGQNCHSFQNGCLDSNNLRVFSKTTILAPLQPSLLRPLPKTF